MQRLLTVSLVAVAVLAGFPAASSVDEYTRIARFIAKQGPFAGLACHALVLADDEGLPAEVANLGVLDPAFCQPDGTDVDPATTRSAIAIGQQIRAGERAPPESEEIAEDELAERLLPPVAFGQSAIDEQRRIVVGVGLNYREHNDEVGRAGDADASELLLFPKTTAPTSAYSPIPVGTAIGSDPPRPVELMDYEAEIGFVTLAPIDLNDPPSRAELLANSAFFATNDLSDRRPIIIDNTFGYTRGKSHPGYLPIGPWLVPASELDLASQSSGTDELEIALSVANDTETTRLEIRQSSTSRAMIHGPKRVIGELSRRYLAGADLCMPDVNGDPRYLHDGEGIIPAGSLILTGTPGGTAIKSPGLFDKIRLFVEGGFSIGGARDEMISESEADAEAIGYLAPGDRVETAITVLGRQRWVVSEGERSSDNGVAGSGPCGEFRHD